MAYYLEALPVSRRCEETEMAAAVGMRRAAAAEAELEQLKGRLQEAEKRVSELSWQIKMVSDPQQIGGARAGGGEQSRVAGMLDMFGCAINYRR